MKVSRKGSVYLMFYHQCTNFQTSLNQVFAIMTTKSLPTSYMPCSMSIENLGSSKRQAESLVLSHWGDFLEDADEEEPYFEGHKRPYYSKAMFILQNLCDGRNLFGDASNRNLFLLYFFSHKTD